MKKALYLLVTIFTLSIFRTSVYASSFNLTLSGEDTFTDEVTLDIVISNLTDFADGFYGLDATLSYDKTKLELKEITANANYTVTYDKTASDSFVVLPDVGLSNGQTLATITFTNKGLTGGDSTTISLTNIIGSDGEEDIPLAGTVSKTVTYTEDEILKGDMNKNGRIDLADIILLLRVYLNDNATEEDLRIGDMNNNGSIGLSDIIDLLRLYLNS